jgi:IS30 family transposase
MEGMGLSKSDMAVILCKHQSSVYRELNRNGDCGVYTGSGAQALSAQRRPGSRPSPKLGNPALTGEIPNLFKRDQSPEQISGRLAVLYPEEPEMRASTSAVCACLYGETAKDPSLKEHFRQNRAAGRGRKTAGGSYRTVFPSANARKPLKRSPGRATGKATP